MGQLFLQYTEFNWQLLHKAKILQTIAKRQLVTDPCPMSKKLAWLVMENQFYARFLDIGHGSGVLLDEKGSR